MATEGNEYFTEILVTLNKYHDRQGQMLSSKNLKESVLRVMDQEEEEIERNINNITCDTSFQSPVTNNIQKKIQIGYYKSDLLQTFYTKSLKNSMNVRCNNTNRSTK